MKRRPAELDGFLNLDKPAGLTSRDVVDRVCRIVDTKRVGHAGTLDPLATGVLVVAIGKATRLVEYVQAQRKTYRAGFLLGRTSDTDDIEGTVVVREGVDPPTRNAVAETLQQFVGRIEQTPPKFSAVKLAGKRAYKLARLGKAVEIKPRPVEVFSIDIEEYAFPKLRLTIECGSGTYIRSIARDLGDLLGVGGLMESLERTAIGTFKIEDAVTLEALETGDWKTHARPLVDACIGIPKVTVDEDQRRDFDAGRACKLTETQINGGEVAVVYDGALIGIGEFDPKSEMLRPIKGGFATG
jgi:tRNA pseudouridine55 synthase